MKIEHPIVDAFDEHIKQSAIKSSYRILYIEDDEADAALLTANLQKEHTIDYQIDIVRSLHEAKQKFDESTGLTEYDLLFIDLHLPDAQGLDAVEFLVATNISRPIIILTGNNDQESAIKALSKGAQDYLVKGSYTPDSLNRTIRYAIERMEHQKALHALAHRDLLTQLPNRHYFNLYIQNILQRAQRYSIEVSVLLIDFDHFKHINDAHGHQAGDTFLVAVAERMKNRLRVSDFVARLGGDEFVVVVEHDHAWMHGIMTVLDDLVASLSVPVVVNDEGLSVQSTCSIGVTKYHWSCDVDVSPDALCHQADTAMYHAKKRGGNCYQFYNKEIDDKASRRSAIIRGLNLAIENKEFVLHYQPIVDAKTGKYQSVEALLRWRREDGSMTSPADFIPLLEETNKIVEIGAWVLEQAIIDYKHMLSRGLLNPGCKVNVNVSPRQFLWGDFIATVKDTIRTTGIQPDVLELEITEDMQIDQPEKMLETLRELKAIGVQLAIDDFGTGFSSMNYLKDMPIDTIKIDRSFIFSYLNDVSNRLIVDAMISLGKKLGKTVVIEGVESKEVVDVLMTTGCDRFQGFYFARPQPIEDLLGQDLGAASA